MKVLKIDSELTKWMLFGFAHNNRQPHGMETKRIYRHKFEAYRDIIDSVGNLTFLDTPDMQVRGKQINWCKPASRLEKGESP